MKSVSNYFFVKRKKKKDQSLAYFLLSRNWYIGRKFGFNNICRTIYFFSQVPSRPPERIIAESHVTLTTIPVTWQPIDSSYIHGILLGYKIRYQAVAIGEEPVEDQPIREEIVSSSTFFLVLKNLEIFTLYRIDVLGYTIMGNGPPATDYAGLSNFQAHHTITSQLIEYTFLKLNNWANTRALISR